MQNRSRPRPEEETPFQNLVVHDSRLRPGIFNAIEHNQRRPKHANQKERTEKTTPWKKKKKNIPEIRKPSQVTIRQSSIVTSWNRRIRGGVYITPRLRVQTKTEIQKIETGQVTKKGSTGSTYKDYKKSCPVAEACQLPQGATNCFTETVGKCLILAGSYSD